MNFSLSLLEPAILRAVAEARLWLGATSPNPAVGAVALDKNGQILAVSAHKKAGEDHAEAHLLKICREQGLLPHIDTLCVTLEPCNHHGFTPPCTEALIEAGIRNIAIGARDPNPHVRGGGLERLREAGVAIISGIAEEPCKQLIHAFAYSVTSGTPWMTVKRAFDSQGSMLPPPGQKTFTSAKALELAHRLRKKSDAILTGSGTILADHPLFTVRRVADHPDKTRFLAILDRRNRVPEDYKIAAAQRGFNVLIYKDISEAVDDLAHRGARDILVEAGPSLSQSLLDKGMWTMSVTFRESSGDDPEVNFNGQVALPFDPSRFCWDYFVP